MEKHIHNLFNEKIIKEAAHRFNISYDTIKKVGGFENYIYEYEKDNKPYILRFVHSDHRSNNLVKGEMEWIYFLAKHNAPVSMPVESINQELVEIIKCEDNSYFNVSVFYKAEGVPYSKELVSDKLFQNIGKTIGKFHRLTKDYQPNHNRYEWYEDPLVVNAKEYLPEKDMEIYDKFSKLVQFLKTLPKNNNNYGLIHTDVHMGNIFIKSNDDITVFDFDDCCNKHFISDIAIVVFYYIYHVKDEDERLKKAHHILKEFMKGYAKENQLETEDFLTFPHFLKLREFILYIVIHRSFDIEKHPRIQEDLAFYRKRLLNDIPYINLNFSDYLKQ